MGLPAIITALRITRRFGDTVNWDLLPVSSRQPVRRAQRHPTTPSRASLSARPVAHHEGRLAAISSRESFGRLVGQRAAPNSIRGHPAARSLPIAAEHSTHGRRHSRPNRFVTLRRSRGRGTRNSSISPSKIKKHRAKTDCSAIPPPPTPHPPPTPTTCSAPVMSWGPAVRWCSPRRNRISISSSSSPSTARTNGPTRCPPHAYRREFRQTVQNCNTRMFPPALRRTGALAIGRDDAGDGCRRARPCATSHRVAPFRSAINAREFLRSVGSAVPAKQPRPATSSAMQSLVVGGTSTMPFDFQSTADPRRQRSRPLVVTSSGRFVNNAEKIPVQPHSGPPSAHQRLLRLFAQQ